MKKNGVRVFSFLSVGTGIELKVDTRTNLGKY